MDSDRYAYRVTLKMLVGLKRVGREMRMLVENADDQTPADPS
jgi:hypothetical protein